MTNEARQSEPKPEAVAPPPRLHRAALVEVNVAVYTARRNAAHDKVVDMLGRRSKSDGKQRRRALFALCNDLLKEAIQCTRRSLVQGDAPVLHYLGILRDTMAATQALVSHEITLVKEREMFAKILDNYPVTHLQTADNVFSESEMSILGSVDELLKFGQPIIQQDTEERLAKLDDTDRKRYQTAAREYQAYYAKRASMAMASTEETRDDG